MTETRENVAHYNTGEIETIDYIADKFAPDQFRAIILANIIKYASRALHKGQFDSDIEKIRNYSVILQEFEVKQSVIAEEEVVEAEVILPRLAQAGDRVRVKKGTSSLPYGSVHTVLKADGVFVHVNNSGGWLQDRFEVIG